MTTSTFPSVPGPASSTPSAPSAQTPSAAHVRDERRLLFCGALVGLTTLVGLVFIVVFFATSHPPMDATAVEAAIGFRDAGAMVGIGTLLAVLPLLFALPFLGGLRSALGRADGGPLVAVASSAGLAAFLIPAIGSLVSAVTPAIGAADTSTAAGAVVKAIDGVMPLSVAQAGFPRAVLLVAVVVLLARAGLAGRGLRISAYGIAALSLAGTGTLLVQGLFPLASLSMLLFVAWLTTVGLKLRGSRAQARLAELA
jgi:hypothetical protein